MRVIPNDVLIKKLEERLKNPHRKDDVDNHKLFEKTFKLAQALPTIVASLESENSIETLLNHDFVGYYLIAIGSLYKFNNFNPTRIVVWSDGSLTKSDRDLLQQKVENIHIIT